MYCDLCPKIYFCKDRIRKHVFEVHCKKTFACNVCDYKSSTKNHLKRHKLIHNEKVECPVCKKQVSSMPTHMIIHKYNNAKQHCGICNKMVNQSYMKKHLRIHARAIHKCITCDQDFKIMEDLRRQAVERNIFRQRFLSEFA